MRHAALPVHPLASAARCCSYLLALATHLLCLRRGLVTSGCAFLFWGLSALCGAATFASVVASGRVKGQRLVYISITIKAVKQLIGIPIALVLNYVWRHLETIADIGFLLGAFMQYWLSLLFSKMRELYTIQFDAT